ncbi:Ran GAP Rna1 [Malassezia vespertilionis]|uniref:Ran GTPase-activating protein 1 n=1 Tax=Malassezia vespertilionis TaxID=2020962 RepID=A0A2N1JBX2_9BASI|nr:Ran GAP Rna1 [Malassezia vespertilionis]PKI84054.1 hypothetical protein MVES_002097 [Malassezia vespertilionis]WFD06868.1 Ran GAP Rna1 [Malassezia vespertilionis]
MSNSAGGVFNIVGRNLKLDTKEDIAPHLAEIEKIDPLYEVHFGGNTLGVGACVALANVLKTKRSLRVADFADIFTGRLISEIPESLRALCDALLEHEQLEVIDLSDNAFGGRAAEPMTQLLSKNCHFHTLRLSNNGLGITGGEIVAEALYRAAKSQRAAGRESKLRTVVCGRNRLENGSAAAWGRAFAAHGGIVEARLYQNGIRMEGVEALCAGLAKCPNLQVLDLQDNTVTLRGARAIAAALPSWLHLRVLNLSDSLVKSKGGMLIFEQFHLGHGKHLESLQLQYCDLNRAALGYLGKAISKNLEHLDMLEINGNFADEDDECITAIQAALGKWGHEGALDELDEMDPEGEEEEEEEEDDDDDDDDDDKHKDILDVANRAESQDVGQDADAAADALADELQSTYIK